MSIPLLQTVLSLPTAPFYEDTVAKFVIAYAAKRGIPSHIDSFGNITIHYKKGKGATKLAFLAHMDHPGFKILKRKNKNVEIGLLGARGIEPRLKGALLRFNIGNEWIKGKITTKTTRKWKGRFIFKATLATLPKTKMKGEFGYLSFPVVKIRNQKIYTKAADDIANVASILEAFTTLKKKNVTADVMGVFTRAEEVGFIGAIHQLKKNPIPKNRIVIVCEASSANFGGIKIGLGPVLRVGDRSAAYSPEIDYWMKHVALENKIPFQRALLAGGQCEAVLFALSGYQTGCLALPLGNYHNFKDGHSLKLAPEYIGEGDYVGIVDVMVALSRAKSPASYIARLNQRLHQSVAKWRSEWR